MQTIHEGINLWIASVFVERSTAGSDCFELLRRVQANVHADAEFRIESLVMRTLGSNFAKAGDFKFDGPLAKESPMFIPIEFMPRPPEVLPPGIFKAHYSVMIPSEACQRSEHALSD